MMGTAFDHSGQKTCGRFSCALFCPDHVELLRRWIVDLPIQIADNSRKNTFVQADPEDAKIDREGDYHGFFFEGGGGERNLAEFFSWIT